MSHSMNSHKTFQFVGNINCLSTTSKPLVDIHYPKDKIQSRMSYRFWREMTKTVTSKGLSDEQKVRSVHLLLNERLMFNTNKQANFDAESAEQAILDIL